ncbi:hypothetical protein NECAME_04889 [Necator americanus]|uniref:Uncharacterized protein n=1 Tax=Necator americanus TaxID=51031 RepID=W2SNM3_NECAM|nr:hypothetical protein NECAME_04889 [Necator americanus]ETN70466.1 hypothetical protein NECAME_04889 [Necator americanus]
MGHKRKSQGGDGAIDVAYSSIQLDPSENKELVVEPGRRKSKSSRDRFALYLIRKPIEVTTEDLSQANLPLESCINEESRIALGGHDFIVRGAGLPSQTYHIPASVIHSSEGTSSVEAAGVVTGSLVISRAEFHKSDDISEGDDVASDLPQHLPLKPIKKKVSRKGIHRLRQRLSANGVRKFTFDHDSNSKERC